MKYQNFAIIFVLIVIPLSVVLSYYIQNQTDTLVLQTTYQTKLNDSTYDAIAAYQINSLNTQRVTGESTKSYVLASVNTFFTTLTTNLGMSSASKSTVQNYVPAILFTTYDGYYIYTPTKTSQIAYNEDDGVTVLSSEKEVVYPKEGTPEYTERVDSTTAETMATEKSSAIDQKYNKYTTNIADAKKEKNYMVKPFIYYSAQYVKGADYNFVASYTLDNYVTIYGTKAKGRTDKTSVGTDNGYTDEFSKSGYLIDPDKIHIEGTLLIELLAKEGNTAESKSLGQSYDSSQSADAKYTSIADTNTNTNRETHNNVRYMAIDANSDEAYNYINYYEYGNNKVIDGHNKIYSPNKVTVKDSSGILKAPIRNQDGDEIIEDSLEINEYLSNNSDKKDALVLAGTTYTQLTVTYNGIEITDYEAMEYYIKAYYFSKWVQKNLSDVEASSMQQQYLGLGEMSDTTKLAYTNFENDITKVFNIGSNNDPELEDSDYVQHKRNVIRNSIQYNLNVAISTFNDTYYNLEIAYRLPVLSENDWNSVLNNVCMVSFMQGIPCGTEKFNSYSVVKSNNNNTSVSIENMYFVDKDQFNNSQTEYHMFDCPKLSTTTEYLADQSAEFKYDAASIVTKVDKNNENTILCLYEDATNTYYKINAENGEIFFDDNDIIPNPKEYTGEICKRNTDGTYTKDTVSTPVDLTSLPNGSYKVYHYDHKNIGCYTCCISKNYEPVVKWYNGELRRTYMTNDGELLLEIRPKTGSGSTYFIYEKDGTKYNGTLTTEQENTMITPEELKIRQKAIYTYMAKIRINLYKSNDYVNQ